MARRKRARVRFGFIDAADSSEPRAAFEGRAKFRQLLGSAARHDLDASIAQIANVAVDTQVFRYVLREKAEAHSLYEAGNQVSPGV